MASPTSGPALAEETITANAPPPVAAGEVAQELLVQLRAAGVTFTASLPDDWMAPLLHELDAAPDVTHVRVAREPEIVGMCCGAYFSGGRSVGILGATGFLACSSELATLSRRYQIPLVLLVSQRGSIYDPKAFQEVQGRVSRPVADALGLRSIDLDRREKLSIIPAAIENARVQKRPTILWLARALLTGQVSEL